MPSLRSRAGDVIALLLFSCSACAAAPGGSVLRNFGFEEGTPGVVPTGWSAPSTLVAGFRAVSSRDHPHGGTACLEISRDAVTKVQVCAVYQSIAAASYRGRRVRLSGWLRFEPHDGSDSASSARIWIRSGGIPWSYDDLGDHPVRSAAWTHAQVICEVARDADFISFGGALYLKGKAWVDDLKLDVIGPSGQGNEAPHPLSERGVENLIAFGRLLGYVRYFHPSDEAAETDWDSFAIAGVDEVESAGTPDELKIRLDRLFRPLAPTIRLSTSPLPSLTVTALSPRGVTNERITGWRHVGYEGAYPGFYEKRRVIAPAGAPGDSVLPIGSEVNTSLGGGLWCSVPLTLYKGARGTIPRGARSARAPRRPNGWVPTGDDRATRLADVILFWNVMQHFWPYFDVTKTDWPAQLAPALREAAADSGGAGFEVTLRRLSARLHDGHVYANSPYTGYDSRQWPFDWAFVEGQLVLTRVDTAQAEFASVGDEVIAIGGRPTSQWVVELEPLESGATPERVRFRVARSLLGRGANDTVARSLPGAGATDTLELDLRSPAGTRHHIRNRKATNRQAHTRTARQHSGNSARCDVPGSKPHHQCRFRRSPFEDLRGQRSDLRSARVSESHLILHIGTPHRFDSD